MVLDDKADEKNIVKISILGEICLVSKYWYSVNKVWSKNKGSRTQSIVGYGRTQSLPVMQTGNRPLHFEYRYLQLPLNRVRVSDVSDLNMRTLNCSALLVFCCGCTQ